MTNAEFIAETITKYHADVLNILKCPYGMDVSFCVKLGDCTKCKIQWLRSESKYEIKRSMEQKQRTLENSDDY